MSLELRRARGGGELFGKSRLVVRGRGEVGLSKLMQSTDREEEELLRLLEEEQSFVCGSKETSPCLQPTYDDVYEESQLLQAAGSSFQPRAPAHNWNTGRTKLTVSPLAVFVIPRHSHNRLQHSSASSNRRRTETKRMISSSSTCTWCFIFISQLSIFAVEALGSNHAFSFFRFAPNGVCTSPRYLVLRSPNSDHAECKLQRFTLKNVPGEGDCIFLAVALASLTSIGIGGNDVLLRAISKETRNNVASILEQGRGNLVIEENKLVSTHRLLQSAARDENITEEEYIRRLRLEGRDGGLYGGGPELTVLSNLLRRPISIYELDTSLGSANGSDTMAIECKGTFGKDFFRDELKGVPDSAIFYQELPGAYHWHIHILVVDSSPTDKHACVLLPQLQVQ